MDKEIIKAIQDGDTDKFYNTRTWQKKRQEILNRDNNECKRCKEEGRVGKGEAVHHIKHLKDRPDLAMTDDNLITVCYTCHNELHPEKFNIEKKKPLNEERW